MIPQGREAIVTLHSPGRQLAGRWQAGQGSHGEAGIIMRPGL